MSSKIYIKANADAPEFISQGNFHAARNGDYFETENRKLADFIIESGHGKEVKKKPSQTKPAEPAKVESAAAETAETNAQETEANTEGGSN